VNNFTRTVRLVVLILFVLTVLVALVGWLFTSKDLAQLTSILTIEAVSLGIGEASNVGKRATFKSAAVNSP
jgi:hypothetical protein